MTLTKIEFSEKLFFNKRLSIDRTVSCATDHDHTLTVLGLFGN